MLADEELEVVIGDAVHCADVLAVGQVAALQTNDQETALTVERVRVLRRPRRQQELVVRSTEKPIGVGSIRPYALVQAPTWLSDPEGARERSISPIP